LLRNVGLDAVEVLVALTRDAAQLDPVQLFREVSSAWRQQSVKDVAGGVLRIYQGAVCWIARAQPPRPRGR
jgi:hypothetical protein